MRSRFVTCDCGARAEVPPGMAKTRSIECPKCGLAVDLTGPTRATDEEAAPETVDQAGTPSPPSKVAPEPVDATPARACAYCGGKNEASADSCRHCGERFDGKASGRGSPDGRAPGGKLKIARTFAMGLLAVSLASLAVWNLVFREDGSGGPEAPKLADGVANYVFVPDDRLPDPARGGEFPGADIDRQPEPIRRAMRANVKIESPRSMGSGVVIDRRDDGVLILTFLHAFAGFPDKALDAGNIKDIAPIRVTYFNGRHHPGRVVWCSPGFMQTGLTLIKAPAPEGIEPVPWDADVEATAGQEVFAIGNPVGSGWTLSKGVVTSRKGSAGGKLRQGDFITYETRTTFGNTGGGLYNVGGDLIGINRTIPGASTQGSLSLAIGPQPLIDLKPEGLVPRAPRR